MLSIFHYVVAALTAMAGCIPFVHLAMGIAMVSGAFDAPGGAFEGPGQSAPPAFLGWFFIGMAAIFIVLIWATAIAILLAARNLAQHRAYTYCLVVAAIECTFMPLGTVLGVFTIMVLIRPSVKELFGVAA